MQLPVVPPVEPMLARLVADLADCCRAALLPRERLAAAGLTGLAPFEPHAALERVERHGDLHAPVLELVQELPDPEAA